MVYYPVTETPCSGFGLVLGVWAAVRHSVLNVVGPTTLVQAGSGRGTTLRIRLQAESCLAKLEMPISW